MKPTKKQLQLLREVASAPGETCGVLPGSTISGTGVVMSICAWRGWICSDERDTKSATTTGAPWANGFVWSKSWGQQALWLTPEGEAVLRAHSDGEGDGRD